jgi:hypothetical protein
MTRVVPAAGPRPRPRLELEAEDPRAGAAPLDEAGRAGAAVEGRAAEEEEAEEEEEPLSE